MIEPAEIRQNFDVDIGNGRIVKSKDIWRVLTACYQGDLATLQQMTLAEPGLAWAQYNYMPPIHLAVREGHEALVEYLLSLGAYSPGYRTYPFLDNLLNIASERGHHRIASMLSEFAKDPSLQKFQGDNGAFMYPRTKQEQEFEDAVDHNKVEAARKMLAADPSLISNEFYFWGEGILMMPAKKPDLEMLDLLIAHGAKIPATIKWIQAYYFETLAGASYMLNHGINPDAMSCHKVTILHDMAQKGDLEKAKLLLKHGASINPIDEEYQSTPLGLAARWGQEQMVELLLNVGADPNLSGAKWSTPLAWSQSKGYEKITVLLKQAGARV